MGRSLTSRPVSYFENGKWVISGRALFIDFLYITFQMFVDEFLKHFSSAQIITGGELGSADPALSEKELSVIRLKLGNMPGDSGKLHGLVAIADKWIDHGADFNFIRCINQKTHAIFVDIKNAIVFFH